jgi:hypothetical protein
MSITFKFSFRLNSVSANNVDSTATTINWRKFYPGSTGSFICG